MVLIPPGEFLMGSSDEQLAAPFVADSPFKAEFEKSERPQHRVIITKPFLMGGTEVTIGEFKKFVAATGYQTEAEQSAADPKRATFGEPGHSVTDASPVSCVNWYDAVAYCRWLSNTDKVRYRLPTEAEWEFACRAGTTNFFSFGDSNAEAGAWAWTDENSGGAPHPVGLKRPNPWGWSSAVLKVLRWGWGLVWATSRSPSPNPARPASCCTRPP